MSPVGAPPWSAVPDAAYQNWLTRSGRFLSGPEWARILRTLGAETRFRYDDERDIGIALHVFRRGPLRIGYLGFPQTPAALAAAPDRIAEATAAVDILRCNFSGLDGAPTAHAARVQVLPEAIIPDLAQWPARNPRKLKKDIAFARRAGLRVDGLAPADAEQAYAFYRSTVVRHGSALRYNLDYFRALIDAAATSPALWIRGAYDGARLVGVVVFVFQADAGYYLHGASDIEYRSKGVSDLLLAAAFDEARARGIARISLLPSPPEQTGLTAFKHKWSDADVEWQTLDRARGWLGAAALWGLTSLRNWRQRQRSKG